MLLRACQHCLASTAEIGIIMDKGMEIELKVPGSEDSGGSRSLPSGKAYASRAILLLTACIAVTSTVLAIFYGVSLHNCKENDEDSHDELAPIDWIQKNAHNITSIETASDDDFSDLQFLSGLLADVDILWMGEANHGDGSVHLLRTRIIKYLHQYGGFNTIAFEVALFDGLAAYTDVVSLNSSTRTDERVAEIFKANIPMAYWGNAEETQELFQYIADMAPTDNPLEFTGYVSAVYVMLACTFEI